MIKRVASGALVVAAVIAVYLAAGPYRELARTAPALVGPGGSPGRGLVPLQFARDPLDARRIIAPWRAGDGHLLETGRHALEVDDQFVTRYMWALVLLALAGAVVSDTSILWAVAIAAFVLVGGWFDWRENAAMRFALDHPFTLGASDVAAIRDSAILKFINLLVAVAGVLAMLVAAVRRVVCRDFDEGGKRQSFDALARAEAAGIFETYKTGDADKDKLARPPDTPVTAVHAPSDEPRVRFRAGDMIGLALSGGGIRSATFNLGLLEGLHRRGMLRLFDYLSTVSGGGYIGAVWSDWIARKAATDTPLFPTATDASAVDSATERHLREFSRFLAPRWGFFEVETWTAIVTTLAGLIPSVAIGLAVVGTALVAWLSLVMPIAFDQSYHPRLVTLTIITAVTLWLFEYLWFQVKAASSAAAGGWFTRWGRFIVCAGAALAVVALVHARVSDWLVRSWPLDVWPPQTLAPLAGLDRWWLVAGQTRIGDAYLLSPRLFEYSVTWLASALLLLVVRLAQPLGLPIPNRWLASFDRTVMRLLGLAVLWGTMATIWHVVINSDHASRALAGYLMAALASGSAFAALRNWIGVGLRGGDTGGLVARLRAYVPQVLAYLTVILLGIAVGIVLRRVGGTDWLAWYRSASAMLLVIVVGLFVDPSRIGLHAFYRDRLARAFTGANQDDDATANRATEARDGDDRTLSSLAKRPLHLICCTANDLSGDTLETLGRGGRSVVLSRNGVTVGNDVAAAPTLTLASAVTASAAAFNSNMGMVSKRLGPAVSFLMTMLNLRLGLWVRHPRAGSGRVRRWPGLLLYREMFGFTSASGPSTDHLPAEMRDLHLSDGGHFENLALYELVRRHCRYILVSDCGADPAFAFSDLGNALRRIREDFGFDISIDIAPVQRDAGTGLSCQHVAIGTINYSETDRGILLYVKPTLTGDEPPDVLQYKIANEDFPHQSTGDQFYDESQFESYRRLGLHVAESVFGLVEPRASLTADAVFADAFHRWGTTPEGLADRVLEMTARFGELEMELRREGRNGILSEVFPELDLAKARAQAPAAGSDLADVTFFIRVTQLMEDTFIACQLDQWWDHPLNLGWVNLFARWATAPSFRFWWPMLCPMYSPGFRNWLDQRFPVPPVDPAVPNGRKGRVKTLAAWSGKGLTEIWWEKRSTQPRRLDGRTLYQNLITLGLPDGSTTELQVGMAAVSGGAPIAGWTSDDFFVPPSYWGAAFGWNFLVGLLETLVETHEHCYVIVKGRGANRIERDDRLSFIRQYRKVGFRQLEKLEETDQAHQAMLGFLGFDPAVDTLFHMNLKVWKAHRDRR